MLKGILERLGLLREKFFNDYRSGDLILPCGIENGYVVKSGEELLSLRLAKGDTDKRTYSYFERFLKSIEPKKTYIIGVRNSAFQTWEDYTPEVLGLLMLSGYDIYFSKRALSGISPDLILQEEVKRRLDELVGIGRLGTVKMNEEDLWFFKLARH